MLPPRCRCAVSSSCACCGRIWSSISLYVSSLGSSIVARSACSCEQSARGAVASYTPAESRAERASAPNDWYDSAVVFEHDAKQEANSNASRFSQPPDDGRACRFIASAYRTGIVVVRRAKDGHLVYGPYQADGTLVTAGFDVCGGVWFDEDGDGAPETYAYFATDTFPYYSGCFGPGNFPEHTPQCTTNPPAGYVRGGV